MDAADQLRAWRGERSLKEAGQLLGCDASYVHLLEARARVPGRKIALALRDVAGVPIEAWPDEAESKNAPSTATEPSDAPAPAEPA